MWRAVLEAVVPFLIPFALYAFWLAAMKHFRSQPAVAVWYSFLLAAMDRFWPRSASAVAEGVPEARPWPWILLSCIGLALAFGLLVFTSQRDAISTTERYTPARLSDGAILPGGAAPR